MGHYLENGPRRLPDVASLCRIGSGAHGIGACIGKLLGLAGRAIIDADIARPIEKGGVPSLGHCPKPVKPAFITMFLHQTL